MLITRFLKDLQKNVYTIMTLISRLKTLIETITIVTKIDNKLYQIRTNNKYSETQKSIALNTQKNDLMNLNAKEMNKKRCYNCEKKNHIAKRSKK